MMLVSNESDAGVGTSARDVTRRNYASLLGKTGLSLVAALAVFKKTEVADAAPFCCALANPDGPWCPGGWGWFYCPSGGSPHVWYCYYGSYPAGTYACGECNPGSSCFGGPYYCSYYWWVG